MVAPFLIYISLYTDFIISPNATVLFEAEENLSYPGNVLAGLLGNQQHIGKISKFEIM